jgi:molecular chaperone GrpE
MPTSPANEEQPDTVDAAPAEAAPDQVTSDQVAADQADEVGALREELDRARDRYRRALADLDNYRKRVERDGERRADEARQSVLRDWLDAVDSVELALRMKPGDPGLTAVLNQMDAILARHGVTRIDAAGARFDPERHEAIAVRPSDDVPGHTVVDVARSGYGIGDEVIRPAQVVVSRRAGES